jgi:hypothetical protein
MKNIIDIEKNISSLKKSDKELFERFFDVNVMKGKLKIPKKMQGWVTKTFGSTKAVEEQKIVKVFNKITFETALYNELRSKRPIDAKAGSSAIEEIEKSRGDPFCNPITGTPSDVFGRIKGEKSITASNVAKYDGLHGLIIFNEHNPLKISKAKIVDYLKTADEWFEKAHKNNKNAKYPFLIWNCLWRSASSIIHGHMQTVLGEGNHYAEAEYLNKIRKDYLNSYGTDFFEEYFQVHKSLGLAKEIKKIKVFTNIVPRKDKEITIISNSNNNSFKEQIHNCVKTLTEEFGVKSFNLGIIIPPVTKEKGWEDFPFIARVLDRGNIKNKTGDIGGMELFARSNVIETDPYKLINKI